MPADPCPTCRRPLATYGDESAAFDGGDVPEGLCWRGLHSIAEDDCQIAALRAERDAIPRHLRVALSRMQRAFEEDDPTRLHTFNETLQPVIDAVIAWGRRGAKMHKGGTDAR